MKSYVTFFLIAVMSLGLVFLLVTRARDKHDAPAEVIEVKETPSAADGGADASSTADAAPAPIPAADAAPADAGTPAKRPLRVATLGWELAVPGVDMPRTGKDQQLVNELAPEYALADVAARLAKGGDDPNGADVAILPLPSFIATYEKLRALDPQIFLVTAFSRGREEVHANPGALSAPPPGNDEVKVVGGATDSATTTVLWALDVLGVAPARIRLVAADAPEAKAAAYAGVVKGTSDPRKLAFSTADASRLVPIVAVAPKAYLDAHAADLAAWSAAWLEHCVSGAGGAAKARKLAAKDNVPLAAGVGGAPEAVALVEQVGLLECTTALPGKPWKLDDAPDVASVMGTSSTGRPLPTLSDLVARLWSVERAGGLVSIEAPSPAPIDLRIAKELAPSAAAANDQEDGGAPTYPAFPTNGLTLLTYRGADVDAASGDFQKYGPMFPRAAFRVSAKGGKKAADALVKDWTAGAAFRPERFATTTTEPKGAAVTVEILSRP